MYLVLAVGCFALYAVKGDGGVLVNEGFLLAGAVLLVVGAFSYTSGWRMTVDEKQALEAASSAVGFAVGPRLCAAGLARSAQPSTWRVLCYSADEPPTRRGLVLVDAVDGRVVEHLVEDTPPTTSPPGPPTPDAARSHIRRASWRPQDGRGAQDGGSRPSQSAVMTGNSTVGGSRTRSSSDAGESTVSM